jgi:hypothetical protein
MEIYYTMAEVNGTTKSNDSQNQPPREALTEEDHHNNAIITNILRLCRECSFSTRNYDLGMDRRPLYLPPTLLLPGPKLGSAGAPTLLSVEHL